MRVEKSVTGYTYNLPATPEQLEAIGMVATEWQRLESIVDAGIWSLAGVSEDVGLAITANLNVPTRLDMLRTLFHLRRGDGPANDQLSKACHTIRQTLSRKRGEIVHSEWVKGDHGSPMTFTVEARGKLKAEKVAMPAQQIRDTAALIAQQTDSLEQFLEDHGVLFSP
jgi:hypothetical protein